MFFNKKRVIGLVLALAMIIAVVIPQQVLTYAKTEEWMRTATNIKINKVSPQFDIILGEDESFNDAYYFEIPEKMYVKLSITVGGLAEPDVDLYDANGDIKVDGAGCGGSNLKWKYNKNSDSTNTVIEGLLDKGGYYVKFNSFKPEGGSSYVRMNPKTFIPTVSNIKKITKKGSKLDIRYNTIVGGKKYIIYRATRKNGTYKKVKTVKNNKGKVLISTKGMKKGQKYYFKVVAYKKVAGKEVQSYKVMKYKYKYK